MQNSAKCTGSLVNVAENAAYLEMIPDNELNFEQRIQSVACKVALAIGTLLRIKNAFLQQIL